MEQNVPFWWSKNALQTHNLGWSGSEAIGRSPGHKRHGKNTPPPPEWDILQKLPFQNVDKPTSLTFPRLIGVVRKNTVLQRTPDFQKTLINLAGLVWVSSPPPPRPAPAHQVSPDAITCLVACSPPFALLASSGQSTPVGWRNPWPFPPPTHPLAFLIRQAPPSVYLGTRTTHHGALATPGRVRTPSVPCGATISLSQLTGVPRASPAHIITGLYMRIVDHYRC